MSSLSDSTPRINAERIGEQNPQGTNGAQPNNHTDAGDGITSCRLPPHANEIRDSEIEALLLYCRTFPEILAASKQILDGSHFSGLGESNYQRIWRRFIMYDRVPDYEAISAQLQTSIAEEMSYAPHLSEALQRDADDLLRWLYGLDNSAGRIAVPPKTPRKVCDCW